ncbi:response regulator transcription factor [Afipia carboxidovorans]|uniref:response regulator transcription factor n=1 Tax=Afipia carboxidovorans TaxID=40137 RepID=UPI003092F248|nr:response regulator transcription factor [Afipia carboxidovorans]
MTLSPAQGRPRQVLIIEDQADTRAWLRQMVASAFEHAEIAEASSCATALAWLKAHGARMADNSGALALIDLGMPDGSGIDIIRELTARYPAVLRIVTTIYDDDRHLFEAIAAGAQGYLLKDRHPDTMVQYLHRIDNGEPPLSPSIAQRMLQHFAQVKPQASDPEFACSLTARETDVLRLLGRGLRVAETARVLGLTPHTVAGYVKVIYRKLNISSRAEAAIEANRRGLT